MKHLRHLALALPLVCLAAGIVQDSRPVDPAPARNAEEPVSLFLLRHAEKAADGTADPALSEAGEARAQGLAALLGEAGITHVFSTEYLRTRSSLAPLAEHSRLEVEIVSARKQDELLARLRQLPSGSVAVVAGHSNTVPALAKALGCEIPNLTDTGHGPMLAESEYDRLFLVTLPPASGVGVRPKLLELRY